MSHVDTLGRVLLAVGLAGAKVLRQELAGYVQGRVRRPVWLEWSE